jgi:hypothetical protein
MTLALRLPRKSPKIMTLDSISRLERGKLRA